MINLEALKRELPSWRWEELVASNLLQARGSLRGTSGLYMEVVHYVIPCYYSVWCFDGADVIGVARHNADLLVGIKLAVISSACLSAEQGRFELARFMLKSLRKPKGK